MRDYLRDANARLDVGQSIVVVKERINLAETGCYVLIALTLVLLITLLLSLVRSLTYLM